MWGTSLTSRAEVRSECCRVPPHVRSELKGSSFYSPSVMARLRLEAATSLVHLSAVESLSKDILPHFVTIALMVQVNLSIQLREGMIN